MSGGPKKYAYRVLGYVTGTVEKTVFKVRYKTLNYNASRWMNFEVIWDIILGGTREEPTVVNYTPRRKKRKRKRRCRTVSIVTEPEDKLYGNSFLNRWRLGDNTSVPFGYK